jgi:uncharacterized membrane protein (DUF2068 family)
MSTADMEQIVYDQIISMLHEAGLSTRQVKATPGHEAAVEAVTQYVDGRTMGPTSQDTWGKWLHILSHHVYQGVDGHSLDHAKLELRLVELAIVALPLR